MTTFNSLKPGDYVEILTQHNPLKIILKFRSLDDAIEHLTIDPSSAHPIPYRLDQYALYIGNKTISTENKSTIKIYGRNEYKLYQFLANDENFWLFVAFEIEIDYRVA